MRWDEPLKERHFIRLRIEGVVPAGAFSEREHCAIALGYSSTKPAPDEKPTEFASDVKPGQTVEQGVRDAMQEIFGVKEFDIIEVGPDGEGKDRQGRSVPRLLVRLAVPYDGLPQVALGRHVLWTSIGEMAEEDVWSQLTPEILRSHGESFLAALNDPDMGFGFTGMGFDQKSLQRLEKWFDEVGSHVFDMTFLGVGSYVGEVLVRQLGGRWRFDQGRWIVVLPGAHGDATVPPFGWVKKRLENGEEDNLAYKYSVTRKLLKEGPPTSQRDQHY